MSGAAAEAAEPEVIVEDNPLALSDEDFMNQAGVAPAAVVEEPEPAPAAAEAPAAADAATPPAEGAVAPVKAAAEPPAGAEPASAGAATEEQATNYEEFYNTIMTPFKANGKTIALKDPKEAVQLMQMGANYTRKMQELVPHRKQIAMLTDNSIDEDKLSFLIDLDKKNPEAIKKLLKDSGIDPMEIDTTVEPAYLGGHHKVTDERVNFEAAVDELNSTPHGQGTLRVVNDSWDQASKNMLGTNPEILTTIHEQREYGIYDRIVAEMDRQKTLGSIPASTPFLQAYKTVGDQLTAANAFADLVEKHNGTAPAEQAKPPGQVEQVPAPTPVATRVVPPKPTVKDGAAASAAQPTRAAPTQAEVFVNPLSMSDDDFLQKFNGRL